MPRESSVWILLTSMSAPLSCTTVALLPSASILSKGALIVLRERKAITRLRYTCQCPADAPDANPANPGRVCAGALCGKCNGNGDCVQDPVTREVTCKCRDGWSGEFCDVGSLRILTNSNAITEGRRCCCRSHHLPPPGYIIPVAVVVLLPVLLLQTALR